MKMATQPKTSAQADFAEKYLFLLREYASGGGESTLRQAYELGRRAIAEERSLMAVAGIHQEALQKLLGDETDGKRQRDLLAASGEFLAECLSPYEMARRGFQDAVNALRQLNETLEEEIKRIAYSVHDEAGQLLVAVHLALAETSREVAKPQQEQIARIEGLLNEVEKHLRRYSHELRPTILDDLGWIPAIRFLAEGISKRNSIPIHIDASVSGRLASATETTLYRVVQEALNNAMKHAKAKSVWIRVWKTRGALFCSVRDDGVGFDISQPRRPPDQKGLGLVAMRERVTAIGGMLHIESAPRRGTEVKLQLSLEVSHGNSRTTRR